MISCAARYGRYCESSSSFAITLYIFKYLFVYLFIVDKTLPYKFISVKVYLHKYPSLNILCNVFVGRM